MEAQPGEELQYREGTQHKEERAAIAKRFIGAHKNICSEQSDITSDELSTLYCRLIQGEFGLIKATGVGGELEIMINSFNSRTGHNQLFLFTPVREDLHLQFEPVSPAHVAAGSKSDSRPSWFQSKLSFVL
jgi:hypothetical protein